MTQAILIGTNGETGNMEKSEEGWGTSKIRRVTIVEPCPSCGKGQCLVELENGAVALVHDDGSFWKWTGEQS